MEQTLGPLICIKKIVHTAFGAQRDESFVKGEVTVTVTIPQSTHNQQLNYSTCKLVNNCPFHFIILQHYMYLAYTVFFFFRFFFPLCNLSFNFFILFLATVHNVRYVSAEGGLNNFQKKRKKQVLAMVPQVDPTTFTIAHTWPPSSTS